MTMGQPHLNGSCLRWLALGPLEHETTCRPYVVYSVRVCRSVTAVVSDVCVFTEVVIKILYVKNDGELMCCVGGDRCCDGHSRCAP